KPLRQLGLPDQNHGNQVGVIQLKIGQQTDFIEKRFAWNQLGFIQDQNGCRLFLVKFKEPFLDLLDQFRLSVSWRQSEFSSHQTEELGGREARIEQQNGLVMFPQRINQRARKSRLARTNVPCNQRDAAFFNHIFKARERFLVLAAWEQEFGVRCIPEGLFLELEIFDVHNRFASNGPNLALRHLFHNGFRIENQDRLLFTDFGSSRYSTNILEPLAHRLDNDFLLSCELIHDQAHL